MKIVIGCDHAGVDLKAFLKANFDAEWQDVGTNGSASVDYPDFAHALAKVVTTEQDTKGILICGSGNGIAMTANKHAGIRAALCWTAEIAALARQHNDANVLVLPARFITTSAALDIVKVFFSTDFEGGRHQKRIDKISC